MATQAKSKASATSSCVVQRCNCVLKFTESTPLTDNIIEIDCIAQNRIFNTENNKYVETPKGNLLVSMPNDENSIKIRLVPKPTRFLLGLKDWRGQYKAWEVENIDTVQSIEQDYYSATPSSYIGYIEMVLAETQVNSVKDNHTVGVAWQNYFY
jgi:hypothetical protein